jgi:tetratricopeptide (TPR) repeat protein
MKTLLTLLFSIFLISGFSQENRYEQAMLQAKEKMNNAGINSEFIEAANTFERIGQSEKNEWLPLYHAAFCYVTIGHLEQDMTKKDPIFDKAQQFLDRAFVIAPQESELFTLQAFVYPGRMAVDPMGRGVEYLGKLNAAIDKAIQLNPDNPRSYYLRAVILVNMPEAFGGGPAVAKPIFETAKQKFDQFIPKSPIWPDWGKEQNNEELSKL